MSDDALWRFKDRIEDAMRVGMQDLIGSKVNLEAARIAVERYLRECMDQGMFAQHSPWGIGPVLLVARERARADQMWGYRVMGADLRDDKVQLVLIDDVRVPDAQPGAPDGVLTMGMAYRVLAEFQVRWPEEGDPVALSAWVNEEEP